MTQSGHGDHKVIASQNDGGTYFAHRQTLM